MSPIIRISVFVTALAGVLLIGRAMWPGVASNLIALRSWTLTEGVVREVGDRVQFEIGQEPASYHAYAEVDHTWDLGAFRRVPLFADPADRTRVKPAGFFQMWLAPAEMAGLILLLLATALIAASLGTGPGATKTEGILSQARWMFTPSPGPLEGGISLHSPSRRWKDVLLLSFVMPALLALSATSSHNPVARIAYMTLGAAFAFALWIFAWHTKTMEVSANQQGVRVTSVLGWRNVPWEMIRSVEDQEILRAYHNSNTHMWELPFPGSTARIYAFNDQQGRPLMHFSPQLEPKDGLHQLFEMCKRRTGLVLRPRTIELRY